ncbi:MAG: type I 3-dehydroquinate dehydratase [Lachnospiraceae bacterium]|nr:type I 3-dehydroquinate dehydratase [Lachnospiraceae bacterium]
MKNVTIKNITIGEGIPKICIPVVGKSESDIITSANKAKDFNPDLIEWRADWYDDVFDRTLTFEILKKLRDIFCDIPLLVTFRTKKEGGEKEISKEAYKDFTCFIANSQLADMIDVEIFTGDDIVSEIINVAHSNGVYVIASNHDFDATPSHEEIVNRLIKMQKLDADITKIAVMPTSREDVLTLLSATADMYENHADRPLITMSMSSLGMISRISGETFGSSVTFGSAGNASAPGQIAAADLKLILSAIHNE